MNLPDSLFMRLGPAFAFAMFLLGCPSRSALDGHGGAAARDPASPTPGVARPPGPESVQVPEPSQARTPPGKLPDEPQASAEAAKTEQATDAGVGSVCVVAAVGDSLTDPKSHGGKYLDVLRARAPKSRFDSYGKGGQMVNQMRRRFARDVLGDPPTPGKPRYTHVIIFGGVNDLYSDLSAGRTVEKISQDLEFMYASAREAEIQVVAITVSPWGGFGRYYNERRGKATERLNAWILEQGSSGKVEAVVDAYSLLSCGDPIRLCPSHFAPFRDGIHFGKLGHEKLGDALHQAAFSRCL
jgi:lysophospholipase L1-like esterase